MQPQGHKNTQKMITVFRRHKHEAIFQLVSVVVNYRKAQKTIEKNALHLKNTLLRPPIIYNRIYCLYNRIKSFWKSRQILGKPFFCHFLAKYPWQKFTWRRNFNQNSLPYTLLGLFLNWSDMQHFEACWTCKNLYIEKKILKTHFVP